MTRDTAAPLDAEVPAPPAAELHRPVTPVRLPWVDGLATFFLVYFVGAFLLPSPLLEAVALWLVWRWTDRHYTRSAVWGRGLTERSPWPALVTYGLAWAVSLPMVLLMWRFWERAAPWVVELLETPPTSGELLALVTVAPILEEIVFRGFLLRAWTHRMGLWPGVLLSSFLFGLGHPQEPLGAFAFGVAACALRVRYGTLWVPILFHAAFNLAVVALALAYEAARLEDPRPSPILLAALSATAGAAALLYARSLIATRPAVPAP